MKVLAILVPCLAMVAARIGFHHARINSKSFALDQTGGHAGSDDAFEYAAKYIALPKPMEPVLRECRVVWNRSASPIKRSLAGWSSQPEKPLGTIFGLGCESGLALGALQF